MQARIQTTTTLPDLAHAFFSLVHSATPDQLGEVIERLDWLASKAKEKQELHERMKELWDKANEESGRWHEVLVKQQPCEGATAAAS